MSEHNITVQAGKTLRLLTAGKYCDRDIVVSAEGGAAQKVVRFNTITSGHGLNVPQVQAAAGLFGDGEVYIKASDYIYTASDLTRKRLCLKMGGEVAEEIELTSDLINYIDDIVVLLEAVGLVIPPQLVGVNVNGMVFPSAGTYLMAGKEEGNEYHIEIIIDGQLTVDMPVEENQLHGTLDGTLETIDSDVTQVIEYACRSITALTTVNLPEATSLGVYAFYDCGNLTTFYGPKVAKLGTYTFYRCSKLKEVRFPLTSSVPVSCFYRCTSLTKADLGAATVIDSSAFAYCTALETVILRKTDAVVTLNSAGFSNANFDGYVYVPSALVDSYKTAANWSAHASRIRAIEDYPDICGT